MTCREATPLLFAARDGALDPNQRAALASHLAECAVCRRSQQNFATAIESWRVATVAVVAPDAAREWHDIRRRIRGGQLAADRSDARRTRRTVAWLALPVGAAAALAVALWTPSRAPLGTSTMAHHGAAPRAASAPAEIARSDAVEVSAGNGSVVFVDDKSGWVVVWDGDAKRL